MRPLLECSLRELGKVAEGPGSKTAYASAPGRRITIRPIGIVMRCMLARENMRARSGCQALVFEESFGSQLPDHLFALASPPLLSDVEALARDVGQSADDLLSHGRAIEGDHAVEVLLRVVLVVDRNDQHD